MDFYEGLLLEKGTGPVSTKVLTREKQKKKKREK
jgi:hypothetical protein